ncbi:MAG: hypothetical protein KBT57_08545 [bacterium]|nr:hypothetical protein [Candidatus Limimorpha equi]
MRKVLIAMAFMALMTGNLRAQVFLAGDNPESNRAQMEENVLVAQQSEQQDRYAPVGSGTLILAVLGGAYLYGRKSRKTNKQSSN